MSIQNSALSIVTIVYKGTGRYNVHHCTPRYTSVKSRLGAKLVCTNVSIPELCDYTLKPPKLMCTNVCRSMCSHLFVQTLETPQHLVCKTSSISMYGHQVPRVPIGMDTFINIWYGQQIVCTTSSSFTNWYGHLCKHLVWTPNSLYGHTPRGTYLYGHLPQHLY